MMRFLDKLLGDAEIAGLLDSEKDIEAMVRFELALLRAQNAHGLVTSLEVEDITNHLSVFRLDDHSLMEATLRDGVVVPDLIRQMRAHLPEHLRRVLHLGATSQDVIDTAFAVKMVPVFQILEERLANVIAEIDNLVGTFGNNLLSGRSNSQHPVASSVLDRLLIWRGPLDRAFESLHHHEQAIKILTLACVAASPEKSEAQIESIRYMMAEELGLSVPDYLPHLQRDRIVNFASWMSLVTGSLGKIGQDIERMVQDEVPQISLSENRAAPTSAKPQKAVRAEILVTLARFNAVNVSGLHHAAMDMQERTNASWALEWLVLPQMIESTGAALSHAVTLLQSVDRVGTPKETK